MTIRLVQHRTAVTLLALAGLLLTTFPAAGTAAEGAFVSDDFSGGLDSSVWSVVDPVGDGSVGVSGVGSSDARLELGVPAGVSHDLWHASNRSLRVMQSVADEDVEFEIRFDSVPDARFQMQGLLFEQDADNWVRFEFHHNGSSLRVFAASTTSGKSTSRVNSAISTSSASVWLRVSRVGDDWVMSWSDDGESFPTAGSFSQSVSVSSVGPYVANHNSPTSASPAFTARINYVIDAAEPHPEPEPVVFGLSTSVVGEGSVGRSPDAAEYEAGTSVELLAEAADGWVFAGWSGDVSGEDNPVTVVMDDHRSVTATFIEGANEVPTIELWYGEELRIGHVGGGSPWVNILGRVHSQDGIASLSYRVNSESWLTLSVGPDERRLQDAGDFNVEIARESLELGDNRVEIRAVDTYGNVTVREVAVHMTSGVVTSFPHEVAWSSFSRLDEAVEVADGHWHLTGNGVRTTEVGYDRMLIVGDRSWTHYQVHTTVTVHELGPDAGTPASGAPLVGFALRWPGHTNLSGEQPSQGFFPVGAFAWHRFFDDGGKYELIGDGWQPSSSRSKNMAVGQTYHLRASVEPFEDGTRYRFKHWPVGQSEPTSWFNTITYTGGAQQGSVGLLAHHVDATFGDITVTQFE